MYVLAWGSLHNVLARLIVLVPASGLATGFFYCLHRIVRVVRVVLWLECLRRHPLINTTLAADMLCLVLLLCCAVRAGPAGCHWQGSSSGPGSGCAALYITRAAAGAALDDLVLPQHTRQRSGYAGAAMYCLGCIDSMWACSMCMCMCACESVCSAVDNVVLPQHTCQRDSYAGAVADWGCECIGAVHAPK